MNFGILTTGRHSVFIDTSGGDFMVAGKLIFSQNFVDEMNTSTRYTMYFEYITFTSVLNLKITNVNGTIAILDWAADAGSLDHLSAEDYLYISNFSIHTVNNGLWKLLKNPSSNTVIAEKVDNINPIIDKIGESVNCKENPFESPGAIIVENYNKVDINAKISDSEIDFDFDYTYNIQGGRTPNTDAAIILVAISCDGAQYTRVYHTITKSIGQVIKINGIEELNFIT